MGGPARRYVELPSLTWLSPSARPSARSFPGSHTDHTTEACGGFMTPFWAFETNRITLSH